MGLNLATAYVTARGDASKVAGDLRGAKGDVAGAAQGLQSTINGILATIGVGLSIGKIISEMKEGIGLAQIQIDSEAKVAAIVKGTGMAAGFTAEQLGKMASALQEATTFGDESILQLQARLLTFKSITGDVFESATKVALNMSATLGTDAAGAAIQLGRALEDPVRGVSALRRTGVSFTEEQKVYIKQLVESNQLNKAQAYILDTVQGQLGDVAAAMAQTDSGKLKQAQNTLGDIKEELGKELLPVQTKFVLLQQKMSTALVDTTKFVMSLSGPVRDMIGDIGKATIAAGALTVGVYALVKSLGALKAIMTVLAAHPLVLAISGLAAVIVIATVEWKKYNKIIEEGNQLAGKHVDIVDRQVAKFKAQAAALKEMAGKEFEDDEARDKAIEQVKKLEAYYSTDLGVTLDETGKKFVGITGAIETMGEANKRMQLGAVDRQMKELYENLEKVTKATDETGGRWERFGKALKKTKDIWDVPLAAKQFLKGSRDLGIEQKEIIGKMEELRKRRKEIMEEEVKEEVPVADMEAEQKKMEAMNRREAGTKKIISTITKLRNEEAKLRNELNGINPVIAEFESRAFVTDEQINAFRTAHGEVSKLKEELKDVQELEGLENKWTDMLKVPMDRYMEGIAELNRLVDENQVGGRRISEEQEERGQKILEDRLKSEQGGKEGPGFASVGFADFGSRMQDMMLKQSDPQKKTAANTEKISKGIDTLIEQGIKPGKQGPATYGRSSPGSEMIV